MSRKIRFKKIFDSIEEASIYFSGPSNKDGTYAISVDCPHCTEEIDIVLDNKDLYELVKQFNIAIATIIINDKKR